MLRRGKQSRRQHLAHFRHPHHAYDHSPLEDAELLLPCPQNHLRTAVDDNDAAHQFRTIGGQLKRDHPTHGQAHHMHRSKPQMLDQFRGIVRELEHREFPGRLRGFAVTAHVIRHHGEVALQRFHLQIPVFGAGSESVDQQHRLALAVRLEEYAQVPQSDHRHGRSLISNGLPTRRTDRPGARIAHVSPAARERRQSRSRRATHRSASGRRAGRPVRNQSVAPRRAPWCVP